MNKAESDKLKEVETQVVNQLLDYYKPVGQKLSDKSKSKIGQTILHTLTESEPDWTQWKEKKCPSFEKQGTQRIRDKIARRRAAKAEQKKNVKLINTTALLKPVSKNLNEHPG